MTPSYINTTETIGESTNNAVKGSFQVGTGILDEALNPANSFTTLIVVSAVVSLAVGMIYGLAVIVQRARILSFDYDRDRIDRYP